MFRSERYPRPWRLIGGSPPKRIERQRLILRCWKQDDAELFQSAFRASREHVGKWIGPAWDEPTDLGAIELRLERFHAEFEAGIGFVYAILDPSETEALGEIGVMPRVGPGAVEVGYWVHVDHVGRGVATEATRALTAAGLALPEVDRVEIHCDPTNIPSAAVPRRLGYHLTQSSDRASADSGGLSDILVFAMEDEGDLVEGPGGPAA